MRQKLSGRAVTVPHFYFFPLVSSGGEFQIFSVPRSPPSAGHFPKKKIVTFLQLSAYNHIAISMVKNPEKRAGKGLTA